MNTLTHTSSINVLLIGCVLSAGVSLTSQAGDGVIVTGRTVQVFRSEINERGRA